MSQKISDAFMLGYLRGGLMNIASAISAAQNQRTAEGRTYWLSEAAQRCAQLQNHANQYIATGKTGEPTIDGSESQSSPDSSRQE